MVSYIGGSSRMCSSVRETSCEVARHAPTAASRFGMRLTWARHGRDTLTGVDVCNDSIRTEQTHVKQLGDFNSNTFIHRISCTPRRTCIATWQAQEQFTACYDVVDTLGDYVCGSRGWLLECHGALDIIAAKHLGRAPPTVCQHTKSRALPCHCLPLIACLYPVKLQGTLSLLSNLPSALLLAIICTEKSSNNHGSLLAPNQPPPEKSRVAFLTSVFAGWSPSQYLILTRPQRPQQHIHGHMYGSCCVHPSLTA